MRDIKFRQFADGIYHYGGASDGMWTGFPYVSWDKYPLEQYTGVKDKNGVEIYEGDILTDYEGNISVVVWGPRIMAKLIKKAKNNHWPAQYLYCTYMDWKVVGNINENPIC